MWISICVSLVDLVRKISIRIFPCSKVCLAAVANYVLLKITLLQDVSLWVRMHTSCNLVSPVLWELELCLELSSNCTSVLTQTLTVCVQLNT